MIVEFDQRLGVKATVGEFFSAVPMLLAAIVAGYLLGSLPLAEQIGRRRGVDIFSVGTGLAGASNVLRTLGKVPAFLVAIGDIGKGALAVLVGQLLGIEGPWILLPAGAAITGHWKSVFTGFRGGDSNVTLGGVAIALFPSYGAISVAVATLVSLGARKMPYTSLLNIVIGYATLAAFGFIYDGEMALTLGFGGLAAMVLAHAISGHMRRRRAEEWSEIDEAQGDAEQTGAAP